MISFLKAASPVLITALVIYLALCLFLYLMQRRMMYFQVPESEVRGAEGFQLLVTNASLKIWTVQPEAQEAILYFGGNAEDVGANIPAFRRLFPEKALYMVNYRGYGGSTGHPTEAALLQDALQVFDHIADRHTRIFVIGRSLGAGVGTWLAAQRPVARLVLVTPFDSITAVATARFPFLPVKQLLKDHYNTAAWIGEVNAPILVVMAGRDEIIPRARTQRLISRMEHKAFEVVEIPEAMHNTLDAWPEYYQALQSFLE